MGLQYAVANKIWGRVWVKANLYTLFLDGRDARIKCLILAEFGGKGER
jgi:hypothetical protein